MISIRYNEPSVTPSAVITVTRHHRYRRNSSGGAGVTDDCADYDHLSRLVGNRPARAARSLQSIWRPRLVLTAKTRQPAPPSADDRDHLALQDNAADILPVIDAIKATWSVQIHEKKKISNQGKDTTVRRDHHNCRDRLNTAHPEPQTSINHWIGGSPVPGATRQGDHSLPVASRLSHNGNVFGPPKI